MVFTFMMMVVKHPISWMWCMSMKMTYWCKSKFAIITPIWKEAISAARWFKQMKGGWNLLVQVNVHLLAGHVNRNISYPVVMSIKPKRSMAGRSLLIPFETGKLNSSVIVLLKDTNQPFCLILPIFHIEPVKNWYLIRKQKDLLMTVRLINSLAGSAVHPIWCQKWFEYYDNDKIRWLGFNLTSKYRNISL